MTQKILVTGARGYLGGRLVKYLVSRGKSVVGSTRAWGISNPHEWPDCVPLVTINPTDSPLVTRTLLEGIDCIYHLSAANAARSSRDPDAALFETATGTRRLIGAAILAGVKRFIFISPIQVYGNPLFGEITESTIPKPTNPYAITHLAGEHFALAASNRIDVTVVRLSNGTGTPAWLDGDHWMLAGNDFARQAVETGEIVVNAPGQWRDFIALSDVCRALCTLSEKTGISVLNLSSGKASRLGDLAALTASVASLLLGKQILVNGPGDLGDSIPPFHISTELLTSLGSVRFIPSGDEALELEQAVTIQRLIHRR